LAQAGRNVAKQRGGRLPHACREAAMTFTKSGFREQQQLREQHLNTSLQFLGAHA
jgi:hypothetical protein